MPLNRVQLLPDMKFRRPLAFLCLQEMRPTARRDRHTLILLADGQGRQGGGLLRVQPLLAQ